MNEDTQLHTYKEKWQSVKLSDSARGRIEDNLRSYVSFHPVRETDESRSIKQVPHSTFLQRFKLTTMPIAIFLALFVTVGTSFAAQGAVPGDFLYPVKTEVNENIRSAITVSADAKANLQAELLEERLSEAEALHAKGELQGDTAVLVSSKLSSQAKAATEAAAKSEASVSAKTKTRVKAGLEHLLAITDLDASIATEVNATLNATTLSTGTYAITAYAADMKARVNTLKVVLEKHQAEVEATVYTKMKTKLDTAASLVVEAEVQAEVQARASLDKAAVLVGEVESKLSTLGQAKVNDNGVITDIDFTIDPMKINLEVGGGVSGSASGSVDPIKIPKQPKPDVDIEIDTNTQLNTGVNTEIINADLDAALEATSNLGL